MNRTLKTLAACALVLALPALATAATYTIDPSHSKAMFRVKHLGISSVTGHFGEWMGTLEFDPENVEKTAASATIKVASVDTDDEKRDGHLVSDDFFNAEQYPDITFASTGVSDVKDGSFKLHGNLTIRDVTKPVILDVEVGGVVNDPWGNTVAAFTATTEIDRQDFNVKWNKSLDKGGLVVGNNVRIILEVESKMEKSES